MPGRHAASSDLPGARRTAHQQIVTAGRRDLERALGDFLALDLLEVGPADRRLCLARLRAAQQLRALQMREQGQQVGRGDDFDIARPGRLGALSDRADQPLVRGRRMQRGEQHARRRRDPAVEASAPRPRHSATALSASVGADRRQQAKRDRQVEVRAFLGQVGRRQVDRDPLGRQRKPDRRRAPRAPARGFRRPPCRAGRR